MRYYHNFRKPAQNTENEAVSDVSDLEEEDLFDAPGASATREMVQQQARLNEERHKQLLNEVDRIFKDTA